MREFSLSEFLARTWSDKELAELGRENLERIIPLLRKSEGAESHNIGYVRESLERLKGMNEKTLAEAADLAIDHAALMATLPLPGGKPNRLEAYGFQYGRTTFQQCGGCKHACSWGQSVRCRFYSNLDGDRDGAPYESPCRLRKPGEAERVIKGLEEKVSAELQTQKGARQETRDWIDRLLAAKREAKSLPLLPVFRNKKFYLFGDRVLVWTGFPAFGKQQNKWAPATILHVERSVAVALDKPMLPSNAYSRMDWIKKEWARMLWHIDLWSPFLLRSEDLATLAQIPKDHALKQLWIECTEGWSVDDPTSPHSNYSKPDTDAFAKTLHPSQVLEVAEPGKRMMSGTEALSVLGLTAQPTSPESVAVAYRLLKASGKVPQQQLEQARSTVLVRIYGCKETGD